MNNSKLKLLRCKHHEQGRCTFGDRCLYSHQSDAVDIPEEVCIFHLKGNCFKASGCMYEHVSIDSLIERHTPKVQPRKAPVILAAINGDSSIDKEKSSAVQQAPSKPVISSLSFANALSTDLDVEASDQRSKVDLCSIFEERSECPYAKCSNIHGERCDLCGRNSLHPYNEQRREQHLKDCAEQLEKNIEETFAYERSKDLTCGVCFDVVLCKDERSEQRFGLLTDCDHVFCLKCIREWRSTTLDEKRGCPACRVKSFFVIPSEYFYDSANGKDKLIAEYKKAMSNKPCKYFRQRNGSCPFFGACFYKHADADGNSVTLPMPSERRQATNGDELLDLDLLVDTINFSDDSELSYLVQLHIEFC